MPAQRRASRPDSIVVEVISDGVKLQFEAKPLAWRARNDFGDTIMQEHIYALNEGIQQIGEGKDARLIGKLMESQIDYEKLFQMSYPEGSVENFQKLTFSEMMEVLGAALDVNQLTRQKYQIDPNFESPTENLPNGQTTDGQKTTSTDDSSSQE